MKRKVLSVLALLSSIACREEMPSGTTAVFVKSDIRLVAAEEWEADQSAQAVGALLEVIDVGEEQMTKAFCTAVRISPRHILGAAHCRKALGRIVFDPHYLAKNAKANDLQFLALGSNIRLQFRGQIDDGPKAETWKGRPDLGPAVHVNVEMDYAIFDLGYDLGPGFVPVDSRSFEGSVLKLYGFPNGTPLTVASSCSGQFFHGVLRHDCDALPGSSGGLIVDEQNRPLALHTFASAKNRGSDELKDGIFEDHATLESWAFEAVAANPDDAETIFWECRYLEDSEERKSCQAGQGLNRAAFLATIWDDLAKEAPLVFETIVSSHKLDSFQEPQQ